ncbi:MAG TPA: hypothetical protein VFF10_04685 [Trueperaceae bacterium]|nr:hypothetical protein [Trueperaceae bacterium]
MYTASVKRDLPADTVDNERVLSFFGVILGVIGSGMILLFWIMGRILRHTGNGGAITQLPMDGLWGILYNAYPFIFVGCVLVAAVLFFGLKRYKEAAGVAGLPVIGTILYYLALVQLS